MNNIIKLNIHLPLLPLLLLTILTTPSPHTATTYHPPVNSLPPNTLRTTHLHPPTSKTTASTPLSPLSTRPSKCPVPNFSRALTIVGRYTGYPGRFALIDPRRQFFTDALGWKPPRIAFSHLSALAHLRSHYGLPNATLFPVFVNMSLGVVADSHDAVGACVRAVGLFGGWGAVVRGVRLRGRYGGAKGVFVQEEAVLGVFYFVFGERGERVVVKVTGLAPLVMRPLGIGGVYARVVVIEDEVEGFVGAKGFMYGVERESGKGRKYTRTYVQTLAWE